MMGDETLQGHQDAEWLAEGNAYGWVLPPKAAPLFRFPIVRKVRTAWHTYRVRRHAARWGSIGIGFGSPNSYDLWVLYAISRGWC